MELSSTRAYSIPPLPNEILRQIIEYLDSPPFNEELLLHKPVFEINSRTDKPLKTISLVCRRWRSLVLPTLFRHTHIVLRDNHDTNLMSTMLAFCNFNLYHNLSGVIEDFSLAVQNNVTIIPSGFGDPDLWHSMFESFRPRTVLLVARPGVIAYLLNRSPFSDISSGMRDGYSSYIYVRLETPYFGHRIKRESYVAHSKDAQESLHDRMASLDIDPTLSRRSKLSKVNGKLIGFRVHEPQHRLQWTAPILDRNVWDDNLPDPGNPPAQQLASVSTTMTALTETLGLSNSQQIASDAPSVQRPSTSNGVTSFDGICSLFVHPWTKVLLNEGSYADECARNREREGPYLLRLILGLAQQSQPSLLQTTITNLSYISIHPYQACFSQLINNFPWHVTSLYVQLMPRDVTSGRSFGHHDEEDMRGWRNRCYADVLDEILPWPIRRTEWKALREFTSGDTDDEEAWQQALYWVTMSNEARPADDRWHACPRVKGRFYRGRLEDGKNEE